MGALPAIANGPSEAQADHRHPASERSDHSVSALRADTLRLPLADTVLLDALGQLYELGPDNSIEKHRPANQLAGRDTLRYRYRNVRLGKLTSVDLSNPLRPVLFYGDAQTVVWLNRNLTEQRQLDLLDFGVTAADAVAYAPNDGLWVYAPDRQQLLLFDRNGTLRQESMEMSQQFGRAVRAGQLAATPQQVSMVTDDARVLVFGPFAGYQTQLLRPASDLIAQSAAFTFREGARWYTYSANTREVRAIDTDAAAGHQLLAIRGEFQLWRRGEAYYVRHP